MIQAVDVTADIVTAARAEHRIDVVCALFSGGHDSLTATFLAMKAGVADYVVHLDTTIGIPQTQQFVRDTCAHYGWPLIIATPPDNYLSLVVQHGFPGPGQHAKMYQRLKERALRAAKRQIKKLRGGRRLRFGFVSGIRREESTRRMGYTNQVQTSGEGVWMNTILDWGTEDISELFLAERIRRNPVKEAICISGECLCGAFARPGERAEIAAAFPEVGARLDLIESLVAQSAEVSRIKDKYLCWGWGAKRSASVEDDEDVLGQLDIFMPMCVGCVSEHERIAGLRAGKNSTETHDKGDSNDV